MSGLGQRDLSPCPTIEVREDVSNEGKTYCSLRYELQIVHCLSIYEKRLEQTGIPQEILSRLYSESRKLYPHV